MKNIMDNAASNMKESLARSVIYSDFSLQVRVGVTGHRSLTGTPELVKSIKQALTTSLLELLEPSSIYQRVVKKIFPRFYNASLGKDRKTKVTFTVVSPLAEGADRLVAEEALNLPNYSLEVVLPMMKEEYIQDFQTSESREMFDSLLGRAARWDLIINRTLAEEIPDKDPNERRRVAYKRVGEYVVDHCDILVALWDGQPSRGTGGTAEIVAYARKRGKSLIVISTVNPKKISIEKGNDSIGKTFSRMEMLNSFGIDQQVNRSYIENQYREIFSTPEGTRLNQKNLENVKNNLLPWYVRASIIAKKNQKIYLM